MNFEYLSPSDCPVSASQKLSSITVSVPRGGTVLNVLEIAANHNTSHTFQAHYLSELGYFVSELNLVPPQGADPLCQWNWVSDPQIFPSGSTDLSVSEAYIPLFYLSNVEIDFIYQHLASASPPAPGVKSGSTPTNNVVVSPSMNGNEMCMLSVQVYTKQSQSERKER